jgi:hypothetical protein
MQADWYYPKAMPTKTISLKLPEALSAKLTRAAREQGQSKSAVARTALEASLTEAPAPPAGSLLEAMGDAIGCVDGPSDLSTNPKYMDGFGA